MPRFKFTFLLPLAILLTACAEEKPPRSVSEFLDDQLLLEAVLVRCTQNRAESRYDAECVNAREAVKLLEAKAEAKRREELEALSQRKREALRRTQQAAAEARRRAAEAAQRRKEADYLAQFGVPLPPENNQPDALAGNQPGSVIPVPAAQTESHRGTGVTNYAPSGAQVAPATGGTVSQPAAQQQAETPAATQAPPPAPDLDAVREELRRRNEQDGEKSEGGS